MKRLFVILSCLSVIVLGACNGETETTENKENAVTETETTENQENAATGSSEKANSETATNSEENDVYFKDNEVKLNDLKIKITETKVIPVGEPGNEYGQKPVFAIWYDTTNLSGEDINPMMAWIATFTAVQDNDPNAVNELNVASLPDDQFLQSQLETIKKDGTVPNAVAYELDDLETPVTLIATQGILGEELGQQTFNLQ